MFIHYGHKAFSPEDFLEVSNLNYRNKPKGGLWASDIDAPYGWKQLNDDYGIVDCNPEYSFQFELAAESKVYQVNSKADILALPGDDDECLKYIPDFEKIKNELGIDAIQFNFSVNPNELYWALFEWDCDSILILNKDVVRPC